MSKYDFQLDLSDNTSTGMILKKIRQGSKVLEFGCAAGRMTRYMKEELDCCVYIVEMDREAYDKASVYACDGICGNIMDMDWTAKFEYLKFDYIIFADVLEHLSDPDVVMRESAKLLAQNGTIIFSVPNITHNDIILKEMNNHFDYTDIGLLDNTHIHFWGLENIKPFAENNGLFVYNIEAAFRGMGYTEQSCEDISEVPQAVRSILSERNCGTVYQFIVTMGQEEQQDKKYPYLEENCLKCSIYTDTGSDFNEKTVYEIAAKRICWGRYSAECTLEAQENIKRLRFDPIEGQSCIVKNLKICQGNKSLEPIYSKHLQLDDGMLLMDTDPMIFADVPSDKEPVIISAEIILISCNEYMDSLLRNYAMCYSFLSVNEMLTEEKNSLCAENNALKEEKNSLRAENNALKEENDSIKEDVRKLRIRTEQQLEQISLADIRIDNYKKLVNEKELLLIDYERQNAELQGIVNELLRTIHANQNRKCIRFFDFYGRIIRKLIRK